MLGRDLMTAPAVYCFEDQDVSEAAQVMAEHQIRRLVILDRENKRVVGIVSLGDLAQHETTDRSGNVLKKVSEPDSKEAPESE